MLLVIVPTHVPFPRLPQFLALNTPSCGLSTMRTVACGQKPPLIVRLIRGGYHTNGSTGAGARVSLIQRRRSLRLVGLVSLVVLHTLL